MAVLSNGDLAHGEGKLATEGSPLLPHLKSKPAPNGVSPLAICQKPEVINPIAIPCSSFPLPETRLFGLGCSKARSGWLHQSPKADWWKCSEHDKRGADGGKG